ncbi:MAG TPA: FtsX-like permease family protein [Balneolaceae bacterium]|nr:FtsX-like permease family protein [Balneolaceae bacterium]
MTIKINSKDLPNTVEGIKNTLNNIDPKMKFDQVFLDDFIQRSYEKDQKFGRITFAFTLLSIFIACLGLLGLSGYIVEKRAKEIAIRKVVGASVGNILWLLLKNFLFLIGIAMVIAIPIVWYLLQSWLHNFAYHIDVGIIPFVLSAGILALVSLGVIGWHTLKAEIRNPVKSLRS